MNKAPYVGDIDERGDDETCSKLVVRGIGFNRERERERVGHVSWNRDSRLRPFRGKIRLGYRNTKESRETFRARRGHTFDKVLAETVLLAFRATRFKLSPRVDVIFRKYRRGLFKSVKIFFFF